MKSGNKLMELGDRLNTPPGTWRVTMPEDGIPIAGGTYDALFANVKHYRAGSGLEPWSRAIFEDALCRQLPIGSNNCGQTAVNPADFPDLIEFIKAENKTKVEWGLAGWAALHRHKLTDEETDSEWMKAFVQCIPCPNCQAHFQQMQSLHPAPLHDQDAFFAWGVERHADVRKTQGKTVISLEDARREWTG